MSKRLTERHIAAPRCAIDGGRVQRAVAICMGLACTLVTGAATAGDALRGEFAVWAIGVPTGSFVMISRDTAMVVTPADVARDAGEVPGDTRLIVTTDASDGSAAEATASGGDPCARAVRQPGNFPRSGADARLCIAVPVGNR